MGNWRNWFEWGKNLNDLDDGFGIYFIDRIIVCGENQEFYVQDDEFMELSADWELLLINFGGFSALLSKL